MTASFLFELVENRGGCNRRKTFRWETAGCEKEKCEKFTFALNVRLANGPLWLLFIRSTRAFQPLGMRGTRKGFHVANIPRALGIKTVIENSVPVIPFDCSTCIPQSCICVRPLRVRPRRLRCGRANLSGRRWRFRQSPGQAIAILPAIAGAIK
jgi:hypothetical protein